MYNKNFNEIGGSFLFASPNMMDVRFQRNIVFIAQVNQLRAYGFIVSSNIVQEHQGQFDEVLLNSQYSQYPIYYGGPVKEEHLFLIHSGDVVWKESLKIRANIYVTNIEDVLDKKHPLPKKFKIVAGYVEWKELQLAKEISLSYWMMQEFSENILFDKAQRKWEKYLDQANMSLMNFSTCSGSA